MVSKRRLVTVPTDTTNPSEELQAISDRNSTESRLLSLAPEIRNRIFLHALGNTTVHVWIDSKTRRLRHTVCSSDKCAGAPVHFGTKTGTYRMGVFQDYAYPCTRKERNPLPVELLGSCRQIYEEAALIPFATNDFQVDTESFERLASRIMAFQRQAIESLVVLMGRGIWHDYMHKHVVRGFAALRDLRVIVTHDQYPENSYVWSIEYFALHPLQNVRITEYQGSLGEVQKFDHAAVRSNMRELWQAQEKEKEKEMKRKEKKAQSYKEKYETLKKKDDKGLHRAVDNGGEGSARALRRLKRQRVDDGT